MLWDAHMHTRFSGDSEADPVDMIMAAKAKGLAGITFTDHLDLDYPKEPDIFLLDMEDYYSSHRATGAKYSDESFAILTGIELGIQPQVVEELNRIVDTYDFDEVIGSTHVVDNIDPYYDEFWVDADPVAKYRRYYEVILQNIKDFPRFDTLAHLDYIFRYRKESNNPDSYSDYREVVDAILEEIIRRDIALEINTGSFRNGLINPNPNPSIIKRYKELGGKLITLGADAHKPEFVAAHFEEMPALLKECGFDSFVVYEKRKPVEFAL